MGCVESKERKGILSQHQQNVHNNNRAAVQQQNVHNNNRAAVQQQNVHNNNRAAVQQQKIHNNNKDALVFQDKPNKVRVNVNFKKKSKLNTSSVYISKVGIHQVT